MRNVDYWVGVPLCLLVSLLSPLLRLFTRSKSSDPKRVLFIELSEMGSAVLAYPALQRVTECLPGITRYFLIFKRNRESCEVLGIIPQENILVINDESLLRFFISSLSIVWKIRRLRIDVVIDLELFSRCTALLSVLSGAPTKVGFHRGTSEGLYRGNFLSHPVVYNPHVHISVNFLALVESLRSNANEKPLVRRDLSQYLIPLPQVEPTCEEDVRMRTRLDECSKHLVDPQFVVLNPDPGDALPLRGWPMERYVEVGQRILDADPRHVLLVMGLKRSQPFAQTLIQALGSKRCIDFTNKTSNLREVIALFHASRLLITNDSGPAHIASLTSIPSIVLYGPETPKLYGPLSKQAVSLFANYSCSPCLSAMNHRNSECSQNDCMRAISVDEVFSWAQRLLRKRKGLLVPHWQVM